MSNLCNKFLLNKSTEWTEQNIQTLINTETILMINKIPIIKSEGNIYPSTKWVLNWYVFLFHLPLKNIFFECNF